MTASEQERQLAQSEAARTEAINYGQERLSREVALARKEAREGKCPPAELEKEKPYEGL